MAEKDNPALGRCYTEYVTKYKGFCGCRATAFHDHLDTVQTALSATIEGIDFFKESGSFSRCREREDRPQNHPYNELNHAKNAFPITSDHAFGSQT